MNAHAVRRPSLEPLEEKMAGIEPRAWLAHDRDDPPCSQLESAAPFPGRAADAKLGETPPRNGPDRHVPFRGIAVDTSVCRRTHERHRQHETVATGRLAHRLRHGARRKRRRTIDRPFQRSRCPLALPHYVGRRRHDVQAADPTAFQRRCGQIEARRLRFATGRKAPFRLDAFTRLLRMARRVDAAIAAVGSEIEGRQALVQAGDPDRRRPRTAGCLLALAPVTRTGNSNEENHERQRQSVRHTVARNAPKLHPTSPSAGPAATRSHTDVAARAVRSHRRLPASNPRGIRRRSSARR